MAPLTHRHYEAIITMQGIQQGAYSSSMGTTYTPLPRGVNIICMGILGIITT